MITQPSNTKQNQFPDEADIEVKRFHDRLVKYNAVACSFEPGNEFNIDKAVTECTDNQRGLNAQGGLQEMLIAQMASIHILQQKTVALANSIGYADNKQYYTNSAIKLSNCFTQQAALLAKLQGTPGQKIIVEHVEVHHGGQAVVGNINGGIPSDKEKK